MSKRENYPDRRKYKSWQMKPLLHQIEFELNNLTDLVLLDENKLTVQKIKEMLDEIALRLD